MQVGILELSDENRRSRVPLMNLYLQCGVLSSIVLENTLELPTWDYMHMTAKLHVLNIDLNTVILNVK